MTIRGLKEGSEVAVHYTTKGTEKTADEIDDIGKNGLQEAQGTVKNIDRGARTITLETADGAEETYHLADRAARDTGKEIGEGAETSGKVTFTTAKKPVTRSRISSREPSKLRGGQLTQATSKLRFKLPFQRYGCRHAIPIY